MVVAAPHTRKEVGADIAGTVEEEQRIELEIPAPSTEDDSALYLHCVLADRMPHIIANFQDLAGSSTPD